MRHLRKENLTTPDAQRYTIYNNGELAFSHDIPHELLQIPIQLEVYAIVLALEGKGRIEINGKAYEIRKNDLFICPPNNIVENGLMSPDFKGCFIFVSTAYIQRVIPLAENYWDSKRLFKQNPVCTLTPEEVTTFCQYYDLLCSKVQQPSLVQKKVLDALMLAFFYDMQYRLTRVMPYNPRPFSASETLFNRFIEMLGTSYPKPRSVSFYAKQLNITPKYLSAICKKTCGERASDIIDQYVMKDVEYQLMHTQKSIKEIACELDFPNISFFGKYVKTRLGMSPKAYREQAVGKETPTTSSPS